MRKQGGQSRKLLIASLGVASMTYVATTSLVAACGGSTASSGSDKDSGKTSDSASGHDAIDDFPVANLAVAPDAGMPDVGGG